ncbi:MMPL family transporter [Lentibacillus sp. N15]|uniref:MMPL family transporter n=1 Tax=Lentibacillus songyuanensis TaxID=3136161 RepID=UPI0031BBBB12
MKQIINFRWLIAVLWIAVAACLFIFAPNLQDLVQEKGQITVPDGYSSQEAQALIEDMSSNEDSNTESSVLVFHNDDGLDKADKQEIDKAIDELETNKAKLGISDILDFTENDDVADQTVADDGKTIMVPFELSLKDQEIKDARDKITDTVKNIKVDHYLTGEELIQQDILDNSEDGLQKTEFITVGLILIILFVVFKSFVAPFIPLLTVGISYLAAQGVVSILADTVNFPLSTFTQIFMVAVMFGIGTDYCILLISRFKEEIAQHDSIKDAVYTTYKSGGKTIFFAGLAVLIGFSTIGLSTFSLYQSAVAVAVGVAVVLIALITLVPFFLVLFGKKLFWPFDKNVAHKESRIWGTAGAFAWTRPVIALVIVAVITIPFLIMFHGDKSYNSLDEIGDSYDSVKGFNLIADSFGPGQTMPTSVVFKLDKPIKSVDDYQAIEDMSQELAQLDGVDQVRSATRPAGDIIDDFKVNNQTEMLGDGIGKSTDGIKKIQDGLTDAASQLKDSSPELDDAKDGVNQLMKGTNDANTGIGDIKDALTQIQQGIESGSAGAGEIKSNLQTIKDNLDQTIAGNRKLLDGYQKFADGFGDFGGGTDGDPSEGIGELKNALQGSLDQLNALQQSDLNEQQQGQLSAAIQYTDRALKGIDQLQDKLGELQGIQSEIQSVKEQLNQLNQGFADSINGQEKLSAGIGELISGIDQLQDGLDQAAGGQGEVVSNIPSLQDGLSQIYGGQKELKTAFADMQDQLGELSDGLNDSSDGLKKVNNGLSTVQDHLNDFDADSGKPIVVIPEEALDEDDFMDAAETYLSDDKRIVKFDVVLSHNPYSTEAINMVDKIKDTADQAKNDTIFANSDPKLGGISSTNNDLQNISDADYSRTVFLMIAGIFIVLVILLRSLIMPLYLIGSLVLTYFTSMGVAELIFKNLLGYDGLTWAIPFFAFVMLMALGIDYSIFLMDRFNEYKNGDIKTALLTAMKNMGTVIISAAVILGGTFGAMLPSGVMSLLQIATVVLTGLFLYAFVMLPLFVPVMVRIFGKANWWPFRRKKNEE